MTLTTCDRAFLRAAYYKLRCHHIAEIHVRAGRWAPGYYPTAAEKLAEDGGVHLRELDDVGTRTRALLALRVLMREPGDAYTVKKRGCLCTRERRCLECLGTGTNGWYDKPKRYRALWEMAGER